MVQKDSPFDQNEWLGAEFRKGTARDLIQDMMKHNSGTVHFEGEPHDCRWCIVPNERNDHVEATIKPALSDTINYRAEGGGRPYQGGRKQTYIKGTGRPK